MKGAGAFGDATQKQASEQPGSGHQELTLLSDAKEKELISKLKKLNFFPEKNKAA